MTGNHLRLFSGAYCFLERVPSSRTRKKRRPDARRELARPKGVVLREGVVVELFWVDRRRMCIGATGWVTLRLVRVIQAEWGILFRQRSGPLHQYLLRSRLVHRNCWGWMCFLTIMTGRLLLKRLAERLLLPPVLSESQAFGRQYRSAPRCRFAQQVVNCEARSR
jgi:hypothetical protein